MTDPQDMALAAKKATAQAALEIVSDKSLNPSEYEFARAVVALADYSGKRLACAESLTGGMLAELITSVPGASQVFNGGVVAYTPEIKHQVLEIDARWLADVVTADVAIGMASGVARLMASDFSLACTGVAGPAKSGRHEPGEVHIAIWTAGQTRSVSLQFSGSRDEIRVQTCIAMLGLAIDWLLSVSDLERPDL
ncbi:MAG: hypothetical protein RL038_496 [Actinomycetota bacterium]